VSRFTPLNPGRHPATPVSRLLDVKMKDPTHSNPKGCPDFVSRSSVYQEYLAEREEILRHKWIESEKAGKDIGFEQALQDWVRKHRDNWRAGRRSTATSGLNQCN
jgi:hypothetical protein